MNKFIKDFWNDQEGQDIVEFSLLLVLISVFAIVAISALGTSVTKIFQKVVDVLEHGGDTGGGETN